MKEKILLLMMLFAVSSLCHAQNMKFQYDASGNLIKRYDPLGYEILTLGGKYKLKVGPSPTTGPLNVKVVYISNQKQVVDCKMQLFIHPATGTGIIPFSNTYDKCEADVNLGTNYAKGVYAVSVLVYDNDKPSSAPTQGSVKIIKK